MGVEAMSWALNLAPVPAEHNGQPSSSYAFVLVGLSNHAGPDRSGAFPSVRTLIRYPGLSERTCLDRLEGAGLIQRCDLAVVAAKIKRAGRRPQGWDVALSLVRIDLDDAELRALEHSFLGLRERVAAAGAAAAGSPWSGVQQLHPAEFADNSAGAVQRWQPAVEAGARSIPARCNWRRHGVRQSHPNRQGNHPANRPPPRSLTTVAIPTRPIRPAAQQPSSSRRSARSGS
jgi:hypothetical protein